MNVRLNEVGDDVASVHIDDDQCLQGSSRTTVEFTSNEIHRVFDLLVRLEQKFGQTLLHNPFFHFLRPIDLTGADHDLPGPFQYPSFSIAILVGHQRVLDDHADGQMHLIFDLYEPFLDHATCFARVDRGFELHHFFLHGDHRGDFALLVELQTIDAFEALLQMRLNTKRVLGFGQNLEQFFVGQKEESNRRRTMRSRLCLRDLPWKEQTLLFEVVVQALLNFFQQAKTFAQFLQHARLIGGDEHVRIFHGIDHDLLPVTIDHT